VPSSSVIVLDHHLPGQGPHRIAVLFQEIRLAISRALTGLEMLLLGCCLTYSQLIGFGKFEVLVL
jgi:hypothetical protein